MAIHERDPAFNVSAAVRLATIIQSFYPDMSASCHHPEVLLAGISECHQQTDKRRGVIGVKLSLLKVGVTSSYMIATGELETS